MKDKTMKKEVKEKPYNYSKDFKILTPVEKGGILKTAKTLLKVQKADTALLANAPAPLEVEKGGLA